MKRRAYTVTLLKGRQFFNGRKVQTIIDAREKTCGITDTADRGLLARRAFEAGSLAAQRDPTLYTGNLHVIADHTAPRRRRRRKDGAP